MGRVLKDIADHCRGQGHGLKSADPGVLDVFAHQFFSGFLIAVQKRVEDLDMLVIAVLKAVGKPRAQHHKTHIVVQNQVHHRTDIGISHKLNQIGVKYIFHGTNPFATYPRVWGHEFAGEVVRVGEQVMDLSQGDHVVGEPFVSCKTCYACRHGRGNVCENLQVYGVHLDGGCQEYLVIKREKVHQVPKDMSWSLAALAEPLTIGFQSVSRGRVEKGDLVLIMGAGPIGLTVLMAVKAAGGTAIITDLYDDKLEYARRFGADVTVNVRNKELCSYIEELEERPNVIFDCVCTKTSLEEAVDMVSAAGRVVELGFGDIKSEISHATLMKKEVDVCGTRLQTGKFPEAIRYIKEHQDLLEGFVTQQFPVERLKEVFDFVGRNPGLVRKAQILLNQD